MGRKRSSVLIMSDIWRIAGAVVLPNIGGLLTAPLTSKAVKEWYPQLNFPSFRPPNWLFAPVWTALYCGMGYSSYLVWRHGGGFKGAALPLSLYGAQLALNWAWTPIFFGAHNMKLALVDIVALTGLATATGVLFYGVNKLAGGLMVPYVAWLSFATLLNYSMWRLNPDDPKSITAPIKTE